MLEWQYLIGVVWFDDGEKNTIHSVSANNAHLYTNITKTEFYSYSKKLRSEGHFISEFVGSYDTVKTIADLGFASHDAYLKAFEDKLSDYLKFGYILKEDADAMRHRAALCPPLTFTETYRDNYDTFTAIVPCGG